jgi:hypothetical protein
MGRGKPLGNVQRLLDSLQKFLKGYWKVAGKLLNNIDTRWANVPLGWV